MKRCDILKRGLAILLIISSLAGCGSSPEVPPNPTPTTRSSGSDSSNINPEPQNTFGGLYIELGDDAQRTGNTIHASNGWVKFKRQLGSPEQQIIIITKTNTVKITPKGTSGYVKIKENVIDLWCLTGEIGYEFPNLERAGTLLAGQSVSSDNLKVTNYRGLPRLDIDEECVKSAALCKEEPTSKGNDSGGREDPVEGQVNPPPGIETFTPSDNKLPDNKLPDNKLPDNKLPDNKLPDNKLPDNKLPDIRPQPLP